MIGAEKEGQKIAVEIKSFIGHSKLHDLYNALGQYVLYSPALNRQEADRKLYLAIPKSAYEFFFSDPIAQEIVKSNNLRFIVFDPKEEKIVLWID
ncbi:MAG: element excision factor XisH family protein [Bacteroidota bacterium]